MLKRVFASDALACPKCGGRMSVIATITDPEVVRKVITSLGLPTRGPPVAPARERQQREFEFEVRRWADAAGERAPGGAASSPE